MLLAHAEAVRVFREDSSFCYASTAAAAGVNEP